jgi:hypothetical protein
MPLYYFNIAESRHFDDSDGLVRADVESARAEAPGVVGDFKRMKPGRRDWSGCVIHVTEGDRKPVFDLAFSDVADR